MTGPECRVAVLYGFGYDPDVRVRRTTQALAAAGWTVEIIAWDRFVAYPREAEDGPVRIHRIRVRSRRGMGLRQLFYLLRYAVHAIRRLRRLRPCVVHAVDLPMLIVGLVGLLFLGRPRPSLVYDAQEIYAAMVKHRFPRPVIFAIRAIEATLPRLADLVITPGESRAAYFRGLGIESVVVPNWIDPPAEVPPKPEARRRLGIPANAFCIAYVGAILGSRDLGTLIEYAERHPRDIVLIAGTGDSVPWLLNETVRLGNVRYLGWLPDPSDVISAADALYYSLKPDHPYAALAAPNNLYVAIAYRRPLLYRPQGELRTVGSQHEVGAAFSDKASFEVAVASLRRGRRRAHIEACLAQLAERYTAASAARALVAAYPRKGTAASKATQKGP